MGKIRIKYGLPKDNKHDRKRKRTLFSAFHLDRWKTAQKGSESSCVSHFTQTINTGRSTKQPAGGVQEWLKSNPRLLIPDWSSGQKHWLFFKTTNVTCAPLLQNLIAVWRKKWDISPSLHAASTSHVTQIVCAKQLVYEEVQPAQTNRCKHINYGKGLWGHLLNIKLVVDSTSLALRVHRSTWVMFWDVGFKYRRVSLAVGGQGRITNSACIIGNASRMDGLL